MIYDSTTNVDYDCPLCIGLGHSIHVAIRKTACTYGRLVMCAFIYAKLTRISNGNTSTRRRTDTAFGYICCSSICSCDSAPICGRPIREELRYVSIKVDEDDDKYN